VTSGIRVGTPAVTTRGFGEADCSALAGWMCDIIERAAIRARSTPSSRRCWTSAALPVYAG